jgi:predicted enzyme related to lactoylglutathione lyase
MDPTLGTGINSVRTVAVPVRDHARALDFYLDKLGFEKRLDAAFGNGQRWVEVAPPGSPVTIALAPAPEGSNGGHDTGIRLTTNDAVAEHDRLQAAGVDVDEVMRFPGVPPMFSFRDADGNQLYLVEGR